VTLTDGAGVDVWADSVEGLAGAADQRDYRCCALMDISPEDQSGFDVVRLVRVSGGCRPADRTELRFVTSLKPSPDPPQKRKK
jgi:hypothetical protein